MFKPKLADSTSQENKYFYSEELACLSLPCFDHSYTTLILVESSGMGAFFTRAYHTHLLAAMVLDVECQGLSPRMVLLGVWRLMRWVLVGELRSPGNNVSFSYFLVPLSFLLTTMRLATFYHYNVLALPQAHKANKSEVEACKGRS